MHLRKILCVDDHHFVHHWQAQLLDRYVAAGTEVIRAYDGLEALRKLVEHPEVDLILLDIEMPVMNGLAFLENRRRSPFANIPAIVISNTSERPHVREHILSLGANAMLTKPFEPDDLHRLIESVAQTHS